MKILLIRVSNAVKIAVWAFKNPLTLQESNFKMLSDLLEVILKVARESRPYMLKVGMVHPDKSTHEIVCVWVGAGIGADPCKRIEQLNKEISLLKLQISENIKSQGDKINTQDS